jgi:TPR repeat protein
MGKTFNRLFSNRAELPALETTTSRAEGGDAQAQFSLGIKFANGGAAQDFAQAAQWYLKAADQNHALAQFNLGIMYARGQGVQRDEKQSQVWIRKAANLGDAGAQYNLGMRQHRVSMGEAAGGSGESSIEAYKWLRLAAAQGYSGSEAGCEFVALGMTREGVADASRRVAAFVPGQVEA